MITKRVTKQRRRRNLGDGPAPASISAQAGRLSAYMKHIANNAEGVLSADDHLHARMSSIAYTMGDSSLGLEKAKEEMAGLEHMNGWNIDEKLSNNHQTIFFNRDQKKAVFAARGTADKADVFTDAELTFTPMQHWTNKIQRFKESLNDYRVAKALYGPEYSFHVTGHSLGGGIALSVGHATGVPSTVFNPATPITQSMSAINIPNSRIVRTTHDVVSRGRIGVAGGERVSIAPRDGKFDLLSAHKMNHFFPEEPQMDWMSRIVRNNEESLSRYIGHASLALSAGNIIEDSINKKPLMLLKDVAEMGASLNPFGAAAVTAFETGKAVYNDVKNHDTGAVAKDAFQGAAIGIGGVFGVPGLVVGAALAGAAEGVYYLGHRNQYKRNTEDGPVHNQPQFHYTPEQTRAFVNSQREVHNAMLRG